MSSSPPDHRHQAILEDLQFLSETGVGLSEAAERTGFANRNHLDKWLRRLAQEDLLQRLLGHDARRRAG